MAIKDVCRSLYNFFSWPFRMLCKCFLGKEIQLEKKPSIEEKKIDHIKVSPKIIFPFEQEGKVHFQPLFLPEHFSASPRPDQKTKPEPKNDTAFHDKIKKAQKKEARIKERAKLMERLRLEEEKEKQEEEAEKNKPTRPTNHK